MLQTLKEKSFVGWLEKRNDSLIQNINMNAFYFKTLAHFKVFIIIQLWNYKTISERMTKKGNTKFVTQRSPD